MKTQTTKIASGGGLREFFPLKRDPAKAVTIRNFKFSKNTCHSELVEESNLNSNKSFLVRNIFRFFLFFFSIIPGSFSRHRRVSLGLMFFCIAFFLFGVGQASAVTSIASGSVTLANTKLSVSTGYAFVDFGATINLAQYAGHGYRIVVTDSAGKTLSGFISTAGTTETYGAQLSTTANAGSDPNGNEANSTAGWSNYGTPSTFEATSTGNPYVGSYHLHIVAASANNGMKNLTAVTSGGLYITSFAEKFVSGQINFQYVSGGNGTTFLSHFSRSDATYTVFTDRMVAMDNIGIILRAFAGGGMAGEFYLDNYSIKQVTTPGSSGVVIVNSSGGSTQNWYAESTGFNRNDSSGYTYTIYNATDKFGTDKYFDVSCSNNGDGNSATCAASPGAAGPYNALSSSSLLLGDLGGATTHIKRGVIARGKLQMTSASNFTIDSYGDGTTKARINTTVLVTSGWTYENPSWYISRSEDDRIISNDAPLTEVSLKGSLTPGTYWYDSVNHRIYFRLLSDADPSTVTLERTDESLPYGIYLGGSDVTVQNMDVRYAQQTNIESQAYNSHIYDNYTAYALTVDGIKLNGPYSSTPVTGGEIKRNVSEYNHNNGVELWSTDGTIVENNISRYETQCVENWGYVTNAKESYNLCESDNFGFWISDDAHAPGETGHNSNIEISYNIITNLSGGGGIRLESGTGNKCQNNVISGFSNSAGYGNAAILVDNSTDDVSNNIIITNGTNWNSNSALKADSGSTVTGDHNLWWYSTDFSTGQNPYWVWNGSFYSTLAAFQAANAPFFSHDAVGNPLFVNRSATPGGDYHLQSTSPAIDSGTPVSLTSDYASNPIYGLPDIGGYEYQPPYTVGTTPVPTSGSIRIYSDNKYRALIATTTAATIPAANFSVTPVGGFYTASTSQYLDVTIDTWSTTGAKNKQWTATSTDSGVGYTHATSTVYTIGDLAPSTAYTFKLDGLASTTAITGYGSTICTSGVCTANSSGVVQFTYTGGYSTHTFALQDITAPTISSVSTITTPSANTTPSFTFSSDEAGTLLYAGSCTPSSSSVISSGSNTVTYAALADGTYTNCKISVIDAAGNNSATTTLASFLIDTTPPTLSLSTPAHNDFSSTKTPTFTWDGSDSSSGIASYTVYLDTIQVQNTTNTSYTSSTDLTCGSHTWYVKAIDNVGNDTTTVSRTIIIPCSSGGSNVPKSLPAPVLTTSTPPAPQSSPSPLHGTETVPSGEQSAKQIVFSRTLKLTSQDTDVKQLQQFLNSHGFIVATKGAGSKGKETTFFGALTKQALMRYQKSVGLPMVGEMGPLTRKKIAGN